MKVGDLVRFKHPDFHESYGIGVIARDPAAEPRPNPLELPGRYFDIPAYFKDEIIYARKDELEVVSESR